MRWIRIVLISGLCWGLSGCINIHAPVLPEFGGGDRKDKKDKKDKDERKDDSSRSQLPTPHLPTTVTMTPAAAATAAAGERISLPAWPGWQFSALNRAPCSMPATPLPIRANPWTWPAGFSSPATSAASRA